ncbi:hypothetical protein TRAPUB_10263 [Trametes pubescens]|uniref:Uncharacterized protein n=1 Tax=Trametes pubescens TaxID=154538 RepID=A0A1M2W074_TRAPU|nr:hypothetical protein TRAPUB_10263 [Trametes pubescens]
MPLISTIITSINDCLDTSQGCIRQLPVVYTSCAAHSGGLDIFESCKEVKGGNIGVGDNLDLQYRMKAGDGWYVEVHVRITAIRVMSPRAVEFIGRKRDAVGNLLPNYILLHLPREEARLGRWPVLAFLRSQPWKIDTIPIREPLRVRPIKLRAPSALRRYLTTIKPDPEEIQALLKRIPSEVTINIRDERGRDCELTLAKIPK